MRYLYFLGDRVSCVRVLGPDQVVKSSTLVRSEEVAPHPQVLALRERHGFGYGKFAYVVVDGVPIILDLNKTVAVGMLSDRKVAALTRFHAEGLYAYWR